MKQYRPAVSDNALSKRSANFNVQPMRQIKTLTLESVVCVFTEEHSDEVYFSFIGFFSCNNEEKKKVASKQRLMFILCLSFRAS
jgi:hypothetical protein